MIETRRSSAYASTLPDTHTISYGRRLFWLYGQNKEYPPKIWQSFIKKQQYLDGIGLDGPSVTVAISLLRLYGGGNSPPFGRDFLF